MKRKFTRTSVVLFVLLVLPVICWRAYLSRAINSQLAKIRATGLPTNGDELNRWYAPVPDSQNAALVLTQAFALRQVYPDSRSNLVFQFKLPKSGKALTPEQVGLLRGHLALNEARLKQADRAIALPASRYPIDCTQLMDTLLPHLGWLLEIVELHQFAASLALESGEANSASSNIVTMLALARTLDREPCLFSQFVRLKFIGMALETLERRANAAAFSSAEIASLRASIEKTPPTGATVLGLIGDRALTIPYFRMTKAEFEKNHPRTEGDEAKLRSLLACNGSTILRLIGYYELDYDTYLIAMDKAIAALSNAPPANLRAGGYMFRVGEESTKRQRTLSGSLLSNYASVPRRENETIALQRLALVALAVENFRNETRRLPEKLEEVAPKFLPEWQEDPFNGLELRYCRTEKGYIIYSVGPDQHDDGGLEKADRKQSDDKKSYDITFTVER